MAQYVHEMLFCPLNLIPTLYGLRLMDKVEWGQKVPYQGCRGIATTMEEDETLRSSAVEYKFFAGKLFATPSGRLFCSSVSRILIPLLVLATNVLLRCERPDPPRRHPGTFFVDSNPHFHSASGLPEIV